MDDTVLFREEQRFRQPWLWGLVGGMTAATLVPVAWGTVQQLVLRRPWGNRPMSDAGLLALCVGIVVFDAAVVWLVAAARLTTVVVRDGLRLRFRPFHRRWHTFAAGDIEAAEATDYRPILDYGGWGIRFGRRGKAYNVSGHRGVQLRLRGGHRLLVGSQRADALAAAITVARGGTSAGGTASDRSPA